MGGNEEEALFALNNGTCRLHGPGQAAAKAAHITQALNGFDVSQISAGDSHTLALSRKKSSWSMMLSGQGGALTQKPSLYYKLFAEIAQTDIGLIEDSEGLTESDHLVATLNDVERMTDPNDPTYLALSPAERAVASRLLSEFEAQFRGEKT